MADQPRRVNYFAGQLLTPEDLATDQAYHRGMRYLHNRLHGWGVADGLDVAVSRGRVTVGPGLAIDTFGRELVVTAPLTLGLAPPAGSRRWVRDLVITWCEVADGIARLSPDTDTFSRWVEQPEVALVARGRAAPDALTLARLTRTGPRSFAVDGSLRRPWGPPSG